MKEQQDRVWELLRVVGVQPDKYHNIFFDSTQDSAQIVQTVRELFYSK